MVHIIPEPDQTREFAKRLLEAADSPSDVRTDTSGNGLAFVVSEALAKKAGFSSDDVEADSDPAGTDEEIVDEPPREGEGSGRQAWRDFLTAKDVEWSEGDTQKQLIAKWDAQGSSAGE